MWGLGVILVNAYLCYKNAHLLIWCTDKKDIMSQYDFRKSIVLAWMHDHGVVLLPVISETTVPSTLSALASASSSLASSQQIRGNHQGKQISKKATQFTDKTLNPFTGSLRIQLNQKYSHLLKPNLDILKNSSLQCQLHQFIDGKIEFKDYVMVCST